MIQHIKIGQDIVLVTYSSMSIMTMKIFKVQVDTTLIDRKNTFTLQITIELSRAGKSRHITNLF